MLANLPAVILDTILARLATLFLSGAGGDIAAAREAALQMLAAYSPQTVHQLRLAAQIVSFSFQALDSLGQAASPDQPISRIIRLRGSAVSLNRESDKAQGSLEQDQQAKPQAATQPEPTPEPAPQPEPSVRPALPPIQTTSAPTAARVWTPRAFDRPEDTARIEASLKRAEAIASARNAVPSHPPAT